MRKFLISLLAITFACNIQLFAVNSDSLQAKVDSLQKCIAILEKKVAYNEIDSKLRFLLNDINLTANEINNKTSSIDIIIIKNIKDKDLFNSYKYFYNSCIDKKESMKELYKSLKETIFILSLSYDFTEIELNLLHQCCITIDNAFDSLEKGCNLYFIILEQYETSIKTSRRYY